jgi:hypothetical protein
MKFCAKVDSLPSRYFEIKEDPSVGFYLYVFENDKCIYDHLQNTFEMAVESAWEDYGVPKSSWEKIKNDLQNK